MFRSTIEDMTKLAEIRHLEIAFKSQRHFITAIDEVNFSLYPGETVVLLGESGCGKSLASLALMRLLPVNCFYGRASKILIKGEDLLTLPEFMMRSLRGRRLAMIFQEPMTALNPVLTIGEQLMEALPASRKRTRQEKRNCLIELLQEVELPKPELRLKQYPHQLSGGQRQRIVIAMALANRPEILIADEPTTALDVTIQAQILALLQKLQKQYQMSMLFITHDLGIAKKVADRICVMYAGHLVEQAKAGDFFSQELHPYAQQLMASIPSFSQRQQRLSVIHGTVPELGHFPAGCRFHPRCAHVFSPCASQVPSLQEIDNRLVRCHLYPQKKCPPPLPITAEAWQTEQKSAPEILLSAKDLTINFTLKKRFLRKAEIVSAVDGLSLDLYKGKTLALVGESGCGKTTTSRALLALQKITSGVITYRGQNINSLRGQALRSYRKNVQIIFQDPFSAINPRMTIGEVLAEGMLAQGLSSRTIKEKQALLLEQVNLPQSSLHRYPHQFSGGQRQRICIARALASAPEIIICDEPTSALDISVQAQILNLLKELQQNSELAYLFITHNMAIVSYIADEIMVMREGKLVEKGSCEQILRAPQTAYTRQLIASVLE